MITWSSLYYLEAGFPSHIHIFINWTVHHVPFMVFFLDANWHVVLNNPIRFLCISYAYHCLLFPFHFALPRSSKIWQTELDILALSAVFIASCFANKCSSWLYFQCSMYFQLLLFWYNSFVAYDDTLMCIVYLHIWRYVVTGSLVLSIKFKLNKCLLSFWWSRVWIVKDLCSRKILLQRTLCQVSNVGDLNWQGCVSLPSQ